MSTLSATLLYLGTGLVFGADVEGPIQMFANSFFCLDIPGGDTTNGNNLWLWQCMGISGQDWQFHPDNQTITLVSDTTKCVDAGAMALGELLMIWDCNELPQQRWGYNASTHAIYLNQSSVNTSGGCVDVKDGKQENGNYVQVWTCLEGYASANQKWTIGGVQEFSQLV
uniref:Ricin B lectin domain-containing protein n=1 Tax=Noctiluca scintillans TaxID=2966 RepID=A0A7S0ZLY9_NOCSC|mmetsp:Transcript_102/g.312  ORF Transcript_102/g.312 Transcript_102/m.312 type:complete len:169 (+) Transcript_102:57-563(+)|eukprot:CAMPEP_0194486938 /NCGR_PEP_ID=MMETSP0253-20130528/7401_1 /TAXON_ID=2966 /ORGANISM="Noctiluca scintillans" /LENGTH=168 /DNA_ID=CAMNT_0039327083 /DNA_START=52 /DNA_END=558 /DNA_ORIENTATION=-